ncbi:MAG TPA: hypothetical protein VFP54_05940 [Acidimicrobiales bacterium]|nr:hypothetical protein [Acidimicrobiales bacterium]
MPAGDTGCEIGVGWDGQVCGRHVVAFGVEGVALCASHAVALGGVGRLVDPDGFFDAYFRMIVERPGVTQLVAVAGVTAARLPGGQVVYPATCPRWLLVESHWRPDGSCSCPEEEK